MLRTNTLKYRANFKKYILQSIDSGEYETNFSDTSKLLYVMDCFNSEYNHEYNKRRTPNYQNRFAEWLSGLPSCLNIPCYYWDIIELAKELHEVTELTEKQKETICQNFFSHVANQFISLYDRHMEIYIQKSNKLLTNKIN